MDPTQGDSGAAVVEEGNAVAGDATANVQPEAASTQAPEGVTQPLVVPDAGADLPDHEVSLADQLLNVAYGDHAHHNDGTHLAGDIAASEDRK